MRNKFLFFLVVFLIAITLYLFLKPEQNQAFRQELRDFSVNDITKIDKLFIASSSGESVTLTKENNQWKVNEKFNARTELIETLLNTIQKVKVKNRVPKEGITQIAKNIALHHKKIEIYSNNELIKSYFIGGKTMDSRGTYMLLKDLSTGLNSTVPFVTHIEGFEGYLNERYVSKEDIWRDTRLIYFPEMNIKQITMQYPNKKEASFTIKIIDNKPQLYALNSNQPISAANALTLKTYLLNYKEIAAESFITQHNQKKLDSLLQLNPTFILNIKDNNGKETTIKGYPRKSAPNETNYEGKTIDFDVDRFYGITMNDEELCILQYYVFDRLTKSLQEFCIK